MKPMKLIPLLLILLTGCGDQKKMAIENNPFLTPEVMCGTVEFTDGCGTATDTLIRFGIALIHHMTYEDAAYTFEQVMKKDPDCFWGPWGKAMTYIHPLWPDTPTEQEMESGYTLSQKALSLAKKEKEKLYGAALASFYEKSDKSKGERLAAFQQGWALTHEQLPDDVEAELFNGLFRLGTASPGDKTFTVQREVGEMAERMLAKYPDHPGAYHYAIHAYDVPPLASRALEVSRNYGKIAPEIPHALHMPSHIFTRLGLWQESIDWNTRSAKAAAKYPFQGKISHHMFHALDYKVYALLQLGEDQKAKDIVKSMDTLTDPFSPSAATAYAIAAMPSRIPLENHLWSEAALVASPDTNVVPWKKFPQWEALIHYGRGLGAAHSGETAVAEQSLARLKELQTAVGTAPQTKYWYDQMEAQMLALQGWMKYGAGKKEEGLASLKQAADLEDATSKNPVSPGELLPAREQLGDMLMDMKNAKDALVAYETSLMSRPNRFNSLFGAGAAAEAAGDQEKAKGYYTKVMDAAGNGTSKRDRLDHARKYVSPG